jgi:hypothetical protein
MNTEARMASLREVQSLMAATILSPDAIDTANARALADLLRADAIPAERRMRIHANNVRLSLVAALEATFPVVCLLVDARFFGYAASQFIAAHPPRSPCLSEYGEGFAEFLASFPPCRKLPYLADVARLEWAINTVLHAEDSPAAGISRLAGIGDEANRLEFAFLPCYRLLNLAWPADRILRAHRDEAGPAALAVTPGPTRLEIWRQDGEVFTCRLDGAAFAFRTSLAGGATLGAALAGALAVDADFDLTRALQRLFVQGALADFATTRHANRSCVDDHER